MENGKISWYSERTVGMKVSYRTESAILHLLDDFQRKAGTKEMDLCGCEDQGDLVYCWWGKQVGHFREQDRGSPQKLWIRTIIFSNSCTDTVSQSSMDHATWVLIIRSKTQKQVSGQRKYGVLHNGILLFKRKAILSLVTIKQGLVEKNLSFLIVS